MNFSRFLRGLLFFMAFMDLAWSIVMVPAWLSEGAWGAELVQLLVLISFLSLFIIIPSVLFAFGGFVWKTFNPHPHDKPAT